MKCIIYPNGYTYINRTEKLKLKKGENKIKLENFPPGTVFTSFFIIPKTESAVVSEISFKEDSGKVSINIHSRKEGEELFEISYLVKEFLSWKPVYHIILLNKKAHFIIQALITNKSKMNLTDVEVICVAKEIKKEVHGRIKITKVVNIDFARKLLEEESSEPKIKKIMESYWYVIPKKISIMANESVKIPIQKIKINFEMKYLCENGIISMNVKFENNTKDWIYGGKAIIYSKDKEGKLQFIKEGIIPSIPAEKTINFDIGVPVDITVTRTIERRGFFREPNNIILIDNHKDKSIKITVIEDVEDFTKATPKPYKFKKNKLIWEDFEIGPKSSAEFRYVI